MALFQEQQINVAAERAAIGLTKHMPEIAVFAKNFAPIGDFYGNGVAVPVLGNTQGVTTSQAPGTLTADVWCSNLEQANGVVIPLNKNFVKSYAITDYEAGITEKNDMYLADMGYAIGDYIGQEVANYIFNDALTLANLSVAAGLTATADLSTLSASMPSTKTGFSGLLSVACNHGANPYDCVLVLNPQSYASLADALPWNIYGGTEAVRDGNIGRFVGFKDVVLAPQLTGNVKGYIIPWNSFGVVARWNKPAANGLGLLESWAEADEKTGFPFGFRAFYHNCKGALIFGGDVLFGAKIVQKGIIPLI